MDLSGPGIDVKLNERKKERKLVPVVSETSKNSRFSSKNQWLLSKSWQRTGNSLAGSLTFENMKNCGYKQRPVIWKFWEVTGNGYVPGLVTNKYLPFIRRTT
jgi:hypothetical protein